ncbi:MAG: 30S ribosome-binding factor RbfA [Synechococcales cyanobacterium RM1_1_8]|nr:30S ribosome-binding factor RbfA [Synechococcales cyanobacterium RM1_1_8]
MSNNRRVSRVASIIKREVSQLLMSGVKDDRIGGMVSVTDVEVAGDLQHVKVFVSIYGDEAARQSAMEGLQSATGFVRRELGQRVRLRRTPTVLFVEDKGIERGSGVLSLINQLAIAREAKGEAEQPFGELDDETGSAPDSD